MTTTSNPILGLLYINNGYPSARWNFPLAEGKAVSAGIGAAVSISYSFQSDLPGYAATEPLIQTPLSLFSREYQAATKAALKHIASVADITFAEAPDGVEGQMVFRHSWQVYDYYATDGFAYSPAYAYSLKSGKVRGPIVEQDYAGDVWIDNSGLYSGAELAPGGRGYLVLLHEIGHALGLQHSFDGDSYSMSRGLDNEAHTVMSYDHGPKTELLTVTGTSTNYSTQVSDLSAATLMPLDIEALQYLYGANTSTRAGASTYGWDTNAEILETIWDGGGKDTIDASNQVFKNVIRLTAGSYSSIGLRQTDAQIKEGLDIPSWYKGSLDPDLYDGENNLAIAKGVLIENAIGGRANDAIVGNYAANRISGNAGNDRLSGAGGNDVLNGNAGNDLLIGAGGNDVLNGGGGDDRMIGGSGNDRFYVVHGGDKAVEYVGGGTDLALSSRTYYTLPSNVENGRITTAKAANLSGNTLDNQIEAGAGNNVMAGRDGNDTVSYALATAGVQVSLASAMAQATGGSGTDTLSGFENLTGSAHDDWLTGNGESNHIRGLGGDDVLVGNAGADVLTGGGGNDVFDFNAVSHSGPWASLRDVITDFVSGSDVINLAAIDANPQTAANDAFTFIGGEAFSGADATGQLRFAGGVLYASTDADTVAEFSVKLTGVSNLIDADIVL